MPGNILLSTAYFGPIRYFSKFLMPGKVILEKGENYIKQTYRNRCRIYGPNGVVTLSVPVKRGSFHKTALRDLEIDHEKTWYPVHWKTIQASYQASPFFEYYADDLHPLISSKIKFLWDLNLEITDTLLKLLEIPRDYTVSSDYLDDMDNPNNLDYRQSIHPKHPSRDPWFQSVPYHQVFEDRHGFIPDLSILDLLFNMGPDTVDVLRQSLNHSEAGRPL